MEDLKIVINYVSVYPPKGDKRKKPVKHLTPAGEIKLSFSSTEGLDKLLWCLEEEVFQDAIECEISGKWSSC